MSDPLQANDPRTLATDPLLSAQVNVPHAAISKMAYLLVAQTGKPCLNFSYTLRPDSTARVVVGDVLNSFETTLTLVIAVGQIAEEAMRLAGYEQPEIESRITCFKNALHQASTNPSAFLAASLGRCVLSAAPGVHPGVAFSSQAAGDSLPPAGSSSTAAGASAPAPADSEQVRRDAASSGGGT